jgi:hypothetical protein
VKRWILHVTCSLTCAGCTTMSLERHTLGLAATAEELRYQEVMDNLAMVAHDPSSLPAYTSIYSGAATINDSEQLMSATAWAHQKGMMAQNGFFSQAVSPQLMRMATDNWSLDPIVVPEKLEALRAACQWAVYGPEMISPSDMHLLTDPDLDPTFGRHFAVQDRLARLRPGWLQRGTILEVPRQVAYKAHYRGTWVWVMCDDLESLSNIALVFQDIARVNSNSTTLFPAAPQPAPLTFKTSNWLSPDRQPFSVYATVSVDLSKNVTSDIPYYPVRIDTVGTDPTLRSIISASVVP